MKPGGRINDTSGRTDCTWTTCVSSRPDWGVTGDASDDPRKDIDDTGDFGPENIFLTRPENGRFHVYVEHWAAGDPTSAGQVIINVKGQPARVFSRAALAPRNVWGVATIDWPAGTVTPLDTVLDCTSQWSAGCTASLP